MTLSEFKAWFQGFTEDMDERPTAKQWERIQARVGEITGQAVSYPVYVDRYVRQWPYNGPYWANAIPLGAQAGGIGMCQANSHG